MRDHLTALGWSRIEKDPDRRVKEAVTLVFDKVAELGSSAGPDVVP
jgi:hypothetical protein